MTEKQKKYLFILLLLLPPTSGIGVDIYMPSLPAIHHYFAAAVSLVKLTLPVYTVCYGAGQIFTGTLSDTYGRKKILMGSMVIYLIITLLITHAHSITELLILRGLQGLSISGAATSMRTMIMDTFEGIERQKVVSWTTITWALGPIIAPFIGGYLQVHFGWQASFYFLFGYVFIVLIMTLFIAETNQHRHSLHPRTVIQNYLTVCRDRFFWAVVLVVCLYTAAVYSFNVLGPFIIQVELHHSPVYYGHIALLLGVCWFLGNLASRFFIGRLKPETSVPLASIVTISTGIVITLFGLLHWFSIPSVTIPVAVMLVFGGFIVPNVYAILFGLFRKMAGTATAVAGSFYIVFASLVSTVASFLKANSLLPLGILYFFITVIAGIICWSVIRQYWRRAQ